MGGSKAERMERERAALRQMVDDEAAKPAATVEEVHGRGGSSTIDVMEGMMAMMADMTEEFQEEMQSARSALPSNPMGGDGAGMMGRMIGNTSPPMQSNEQSWSQWARGEPVEKNTSAKAATLADVKAIMRNSEVSNQRKMIADQLAVAAHCTGKRGPSPPSEASSLSPPVASRERAESSVSESSEGSASPRSTRSTPRGSRVRSKSSDKMGKSERLAAERSVAQSLSKAWIEDFFIASENDQEKATFMPYVPYTKTHRTRADTV